MKRENLFFQFLNILIFIFLLSCNKGQYIRNKTEMLIQNDWHIVSYQYKTNPAAAYSTISMTTCEKNVILSFYGDGAYKCTSLCTYRLPFLVQGSTWKFSQNETAININNRDFYTEQLADYYLVLNYTDKVGTVIYYYRVILSN